jgi:DNA-directed RNA polymerase specialized sigma24 family protein
MQVALSLESLSLELVEKAVAGAKWAGAQQAVADDAGQEMALAVLTGKRVESPRKYGQWMAKNATNPNRKKSNSEVAFSVVEQEDPEQLDAVYSADHSFWLDVEEACSVFEFACLVGRFRDNHTLQELSDRNQVSIAVIAKAIKRALLKLKEVMQ